MKKSILYSSLFLVGTIYMTGCTETVPTNGANSNAERPDVFIVRDPTNERVNGNGSTISPLAAHAGLDPSHVRGARIYDDFIIELGAAPPADNPLTALADPAAGIAPGEWRCSACHGFDYEGAATFNGAEINLQDLLPVRGRDEESVIHMLMGGFLLSDGSIAHDYTGILTAQAMVDVADFVVNEIYDTHEWLSAATGVALGDMMEGGGMFNETGTTVQPTGVPPFIRADGTGFGCSVAGCHDAGSAIDGAALKAAAIADPARFLHRTNFGSPRAGQSFGYGDITIMPGLYEVVLTDGLHFGGPEQASATMHFVQMNF